MTKRFMKLSALLAVAVFVAMAFSSKKVDYSSSIFITNPVGSVANVPYEYEVNLNSQAGIPYLGKSFHGFSYDLGFSESSGNYKAVNRLGYLGKYQFGRSTLNWVGIYNTSQFLNSPLLQEKAFEALISKNKWVLRDYIDEFVGQTINGIKITESGLVAAAHLGGAGNVKKFLDSNGEIVFKDANHVPITKYMKRFVGYDISQILPDNNARATL
ncbi:hypothetical protein K8089_13585 [Aequorivita sp. F47161]|jgi:hypothetical protein|uniref:Peptidoglycan-binding protein LysM n=1 Tax=Aequorivita vitellina TaxID=2874475 RepID=A0A9X1QV22_9FLAO|nr:hypothetical protein [Aequorivita vitellina]MCG2420056.1 hypothetical protein [Aequorivita vitellina]MCZ4320207.1 hypothetical protein [Aequorivita viscosa]